MGRLPVTPRKVSPPLQVLCVCRFRAGARHGLFFLDLTFAEPPLLRFVLDAALFAFQLRGEQFALFALPRKRRACDTSPYCLFRLNHILAFQSLSPIAEVDATPVDFIFAGKDSHKN